MLIAACLGLLAALPQTAPQEPDPAGYRPLGSSGLVVRFENLSGIGDVSLWLSVSVGSAHDPAGQTGLARVLAEVLRSELPVPSETRPQEIVVLPEHTLIGLTVPRALAQRELQRFAGWLRGELQVDDDAILRARGRTLLRADDELSTLPGPVLRGRARRASFGDSPDGRPEGGWPEQIRTLRPELVRARLREHWVPQRAALLAVGDCSEELQRAALGFLGEIEDRTAPALSIEAAPEQAVLTVSQHSRIDAPFVLLAIPVPVIGDEAFEAFMLAMEVVRGRAGRRFALIRGGELAAEFPTFFYPLENLPRLAFVERRGENGDSVETTLGELQRFAAEQRSDPPDSSELTAAKLSLASRLRIPPYTDREMATMRRFPSFLHQRAGLLIRYLVHGWPADLVDRIARVPDEAAAAALSAAFPIEGLSWFGMRPMPGMQPDGGKPAVVPESGTRAGSGSG